MEQEVKVSFRVSDNGTLQVIDNAGRKLAEFANTAHTAGANSTSAFSKLGATLITLNQTLQLARSAMQAVAGPLESIVKSATESERATSMLANTLKATGDHSAKSVEELEKLATALEKVTTYSDEEIKSVETMLVRFGAARKDIPFLTESVLGLSTAMGRDLQGSALAVAAALGGNFTMAQRAMKLHFDDNSSSAEKFAAIMKALSGTYMPMARTDAETFGGSLKQLANQWDNVKEEMGNALVKSEAVRGVMATLKEELIGLAGRTADWVTAHRELIDAGIQDFFTTTLPAAASAVNTTAQAISGLVESYRTLKEVASYLDPEAWATESVGRAKQAPAFRSVGFVGPMQPTFTSGGFVGPMPASLPTYAGPDEDAAARAKKQFEDIQKRNMDSIRHGMEELKAVQQSNLDIMEAQNTAAETAVSLAERRLTLAVDAGSSYSTLLDLAKQADATERESLDRQIQAIEVQRQQHAEEIEHLQKLSQSNLSAEDRADVQSKINQLQDARPGLEAKWRSEIEKTQTRLDSTTDRMRQINLLATTTLDFKNVINNPVDAFEDALSQMLEKKFSFDLQVADNFKVHLPGEIGIGFKIISELWGGTMSDMLGSASSTAGGIGGIFKQLAGMFGGGGLPSGVTSADVAAANAAGGSIDGVSGGGGMLSGAAMGGLAGLAFTAVIGGIQKGSRTPEGRRRLAGGAGAMGLLGGSIALPAAIEYLGLNDTQARALNAWGGASAGAAGASAGVAGASAMAWGGPIGAAIGGTLGYMAPDILEAFGIMSNKTKEHSILSGVNEFLDQSGIPRMYGENLKEGITGRNPLSILSRGEWGKASSVEGQLLGGNPKALLAQYQSAIATLESRLGTDLAFVTKSPEELAKQFPDLAGPLTGLSRGFAGAPGAVTAAYPGARILGSILGGDDAEARAFTANAIAGQIGLSGVSRSGAKDELRMLLGKAGISGLAGGADAMNRAAIENGTGTWASAQQQAEDLVSVFGELPDTIDKSVIAAQSLRDTSQGVLIDTDKLVKQVEQLRSLYDAVGKAMDTGLGGALTTGGGIAGVSASMHTAVVQASLDATRQNLMLFAQGNPLWQQAQDQIMGGRGGDAMATMDELVKQMGPQIEALDALTTQLEASQKATEDMAAAIKAFGGYAESAVSGVITAAIGGGDTRSAKAGGTVSLLGGVASDLVSRIVDSSPEMKALMSFSGKLGGGALSDADSMTMRGLVKGALAAAEKAASSVESITLPLRNYALVSGLVDLSDQAGGALESLQTSRLAAPQRRSRAEAQLRDAYSRYSAASANSDVLEGNIDKEKALRDIMQYGGDLGSMAGQYATGTAQNRYLSQQAENAYRFVQDKADVLADQITATQRNTEAVEKLTDKIEAAASGSSAGTTITANYYASENGAMSDKDQFKAMLVDVVRNTSAGQVIREVVMG